MAILRGELQAVVTRLLKTSTVGGDVTLDALGEALGSMAIAMDEIDAVVSALEAQGRRVVGATGPGAEAHLRRVVPAVRELRASQTRRPTLAEVAAKAGITPEQALLGLALLRIMQR